MVDLVYCLTNLLFFGILLSCYCTNLNSSIICFLFSGDIYFSFGISLSFSSVFKCDSFECNYFGDFETLVILSAVLLPIKSPVTPAVF